MGKSLETSYRFVLSQVLTHRRQARQKSNNHPECLPLADSWVNYSRLRDNRILWKYFWGRLKVRYAPEGSIYCYRDIQFPIIPKTLNITPTSTNYLKGIRLGGVLQFWEHTFFFIRIKIKNSIVCLHMEHDLILRAIHTASTVLFI